MILYSTLKGCLCWFWDKNEAKKKIGILADYYEGSPYPFYELDGGVYSHCEPVKEEDVTFYADKDCVTRGLRKAKKELIDGIEQYLEDEIKYYEQEYSDNEYVNYVEAALDDGIHISCFENDKIVELARKLVEEM